MHERSIALGMAIDESSLANYTSALNSYITFCRMHGFPIDPTPDTLSFYAVYICHHIKPSSVGTYLSGICNQLEVYFPEVRKARSSALVKRTLQGCKRLKESPTIRKSALTTSQLTDICAAILVPSASHDDLLFIAILLTGFYALMRLGELTFPDKVALRNWNKISKRVSVKFPTADSYGFFLLSHKADPFFEGNQIIVARLISSRPAPLPHFNNYLASRDSRFPFSPELWLRENGQVPTRSWFITRLARFCDNSIAGQSMRGGGATALAEAGVSPHIIQATGRWASETFQIYIRKSPVLIQALIWAKLPSATSV